jgi:hypothetical protein
MHANMPQKIAKYDPKRAKYDPKRAKYDLLCNEEILAKIKKTAFCISIMFLFTYACITLLDFLANFNLKPQSL